MSVKLDFEGVIPRRSPDLFAFYLSSELSFSFEVGLLLDLSGQ